MVMLSIYFTLLFGATVAIGVMKPEALELLPLGGTDALDVAGYEVDEQSWVDRFTPAQEKAPKQKLGAGQVGLVSVFLGITLSGTILLMLPIVWTYSAIKWEIGYQRSFARTLLVLPICATTIVLLVQNNLALAFGLAAMVAAVRFRVALEEAIDGIFIFASICVGLAAGIGHLGIAAVMAVFFCFTNIFLWKMEFGRNPIDDARVAKKQAKSAASISASNTSH